MASRRHAPEPRCLAALLGLALAICEASNLDGLVHEGDSLTGYFEIPSLPNSYFVHLNSQLYWRPEEGDDEVLVQAVGDGKQLDQWEQDQNAKLAAYMDKIKASLATTSNPSGTLYVLTHIPPFFDTIDEGNGWANWKKSSREEVFKILSTPRIPIVFLCGHFHANVIKSTTFDGLPVSIIVTSSAGTIMRWAPLDNFEDKEADPGAAVAASEVAVKKIKSAFVEDILLMDFANAAQHIRERLIPGYTTSGMRLFLFDPEGGFRQKWFTIEDLYKGTPLDAGSFNGAQDVASIVNLKAEPDQSSILAELKKAALVNPAHGALVQKNARPKARTAFVEDTAGEDATILVHICDPQLGMQHLAGKTLAEKSDHLAETKTLAALVLAAKAMTPAAVFVGGDMQNSWPWHDPHKADAKQLAEGEVADAHSAFDLLGDVPTIYLPGNHDVDDVPDEQALKDYKTNWHQQYGDGAQSLAVGSAGSVHGRSRRDRLRHLRQNAIRAIVAS